MIVAQACSLKRRKEREEGGEEEDEVIDGRREKDDIPFYILLGCSSSSHSSSLFSLVHSHSIPHPNSLRQRPNALSFSPFTLEQQHTMSTSDKPTVLIVGAGLGGLMLGALLEQSGVPYTIFERSSSLKPLGIVQARTHRLLRLETSI